MQNVKPSTIVECGAYLAHEVNQPLTAILINAETALEWLMNETPNLEAARRAVGHVIGNCHRAGYVVSSIRNMTRKPVRGTDEIELAQVIAETLDLNGPSFARYCVGVEFESPRKVFRVQGDRGQLERVVTNLLANALESMSRVKDRAHTLRVRVEHVESSRLVVAISDTGTGIDAGAFEDIFDPWFTTKSDGMGLGLSICRSIVEAHGGQLWASPNEPNGAIFSFSLPLGKASPRQRCSARATSNPGPARLSACV